MTGAEMEFVNAKQAAEVLGVNERTVRRWVQARKIRASNLGVRVIRISKADLAAFVAARAVTAPGPEDAQ